MILCSKSSEVTLGLTGILLALLLAGPCVGQKAQKQSAESSEPHQMIVTGQGFIAIDTPKGWEQSQGPGLVFFLPEGVEPNNAEVWIYISGAPVGPNEEDKDTKSYILSDIAGFKQHFKNGVVREEKPLLLPEVKQQAAVYTFQSGESHNSFEQVVYIADAGRVLTLTLSAKSSGEFEQSLQLFHTFAESYRGSIQMGSGDDKK